MNVKTTACALLWLLTVCGSARAAVPGHMNFQGRLTDSLGNLLNGTFDLTFRIYDDSVGGSTVYDETHTNVPVTSGLFSVLIGGKSFILPFDNFVFVGKDRYLGVQVDALPELTPRTRLVTSPYAFRVSTVDSATGGTIEGKLTVTAETFVLGNMGVGTELPSAGAAPSVSRVIEVEAPATGGLTSGAALTLTDGGVGNTWDMIATSFSGVFGIFANGTGQFYIESNGDVGLGSTSPSTGTVNVASKVLEIDAPLVGANNSGAALTLVDGNLGFAWDIVATSAAGNNLAIFSNGSGRVYIEPNGDFGLGASTPSTGAVNVASRVLEISAPFVAANNSGAALTLSDGGFGSSWDVIATSSTGGLGIYGNNNQVMFMEPNGEVGIGTATPSVELHVVGDICYTGGIGACSDARYKTDVHTLSNALEQVTQLRGVTYRWNRAEFPDRKFDGERHVGFIAQEVEQLYPEIVLTDDDGYRSVDYSRLTPVLVEAIKSQQTQIQSQRQEIDELKSLVQQLAIRLDQASDAQYGMK